MLPHLPATVNALVHFPCTFLAYEHSSQERTLTFKAFRPSPAKFPPPATGLFVLFSNYITELKKIAEEIADAVPQLRERTCRDIRLLLRPEAAAATKL